MRTWMAVPLATFVVLAGCTDGNEAETPNAIVEADDAVGNMTNVTGPAVNVAPTAVLNASIDGLVATFNVTVDDADGDALNWTLDADGDQAADANGTTSGVVAFTFPAAGDYVATLSVMDGNSTTLATFNITIAPQAPPLPGQHAEGSFYAGGATLIGCFGDIFGVGYPAQLDGIFYDSFAVEPHTIGYAYTASVSAPAQDSPGFAFLDANRGVIASGFMSEMAAGNVPEGAALGVWWTCAGAAVTTSYDSVPV